MPGTNTNKDDVAELREVIRRLEQDRPAARPEYKWNAFLVCAGLLLLVYPAIVMWKHDSSKPFTTQETLVGGQASILVVAIVGFIGVNLSSRKTRHDEKNNHLSLVARLIDVKAEANDAKQTASTAVVVTQETFAKLQDELGAIKKSLNGELDQRIVATVDKALDAALDRRMDALADKIADRLTAPSGKVRT